MKIVRITEDTIVRPHQFVHVKPGQTLAGMMEQFQGLKEFPGEADNPLIMAALGIRSGVLTGRKSWTEVHGDELAWCSGILELFAHALGLNTIADIPPHVKSELPDARGRMGQRSVRNYCLKARAWAYAGLMVWEPGDTLEQLQEVVHANCVIGYGRGDRPYADWRDLRGFGHVAAGISVTSDPWKVHSVGGNERNQIRISNRSPRDVLFVVDLTKPSQHWGETTPA
ncbi:MAG: hypothetical protein AAF479_16755 [Pseudomonadota bacterium]